MHLDLVVREENDAIDVVDSDESVLAALRVSEWESKFFGRRMGALSLDLARLLCRGADVLRRVLGVVTEGADRLGYSLVQLHVDVAALPIASALEDQGFRLVDTRVTFLSRVRPKEMTPHRPPFGTIDGPRPEDLAQVQRLTSEGFARNPSFFSRYKHRVWFGPEDTERWYAAWIENHFGDPDSAFAIWRLEDRPIGYYFYTRKGELEGIPLFKGMLTAVDGAHLGHRAHLFLQTYLYERMNAEEVWLDNTTQLTNMPVLHNHIASAKCLDRIELTFFR